MEQPQESKVNKDDSNLAVATVEDDSDDDCERSGLGLNAKYFGLTAKEEIAARRLERERYAAIQKCQLRREELFTELTEKVVSALIDNSADLIAITIESFKRGR